MYIIFNSHENAFFTNDNDWCKEYPNARLFEEEDLQTAEDIVDTMPIGQGIVILEDYGLASENEVY